MTFLFLRLFSIFFDFSNFWKAHVVIFLHFLPIFLFSISSFSEAIFSSLQTADKMTVFLDIMYSDVVSCLSVFFSFFNVIHIKWIFYNTTILFGAHRQFSKNVQIATIDDGINEKVTLTDEIDVSHKVKEYLEEKFVKKSDVELEHISILLVSYFKRFGHKNTSES